MQFFTVASIAAIASVASAAANVTTATATQKTTTLVTITSCEDHVCQETVSPALVSTATVTVNDVITEYTTWCPIPTEAAQVSKNTTAPAPATSKASNATSSHTVTSFEGAANQVLPAAGALFAGVAALLL
ncbi:putative covalently bound cell wall protein 22 [Maudiozyma exigua]|uniref:Covalently bound cell wall protein 22 n=1 Tax=Maudiozyma exigua TaxID=34358 RepID=A0A9P6VVH7_MAUEX|nr:putative covalently bound cell wall protein 22 [Kazachstania exigua]